MNSLEQNPLAEPQANDSVKEETTDTATPQPEATSEAPTAAPEAEAEPATPEAGQAEPQEEVPEAETPTEGEPAEEASPEATTEATSQETEPAEEQTAPEAPSQEAEPDEAPAPEAASQETEPDEAPAAEPATSLTMTKEEVMARVNSLIESGETSDKQELDLLKQLYYKHHNTEAMAARQAYIDAGGDPNDYVPKADPTEEQFKAAMQTIRQRRSDMQAALEKERQDNLARKLAVIEKIKELATTPEEANKSYEQFRALQAEWKETGSVPPEHVSEIWKNYHLYVEQFYDMLKLNSEMREYDFRKNLEAKVTLCEQAEKLKDEADVVAAINRLQTLHQEWKEIGPIAKDLREEIWNRFKEASTVIRKRHQEYFETRKQREEENLRRKTEICEKVEAIETEALKSYSQWDAKTKEIKAMQAEWKTIGYAPHKVNTQIFERFRAACDSFFSQKATFFKQVKESLSENLKKKTALAEQAEALKDSTEWRKTTEALVALQKEWKSIGPVPRKVSDQLWKRFSGACDQFFAAKGKAHAEQRTEQHANLEAKRAILARLRTLAEDTEGHSIQDVRDMQEEWNAIGHVPMKEKDKVYEQYRELLDTLYKAFNVSQAQRRLSSFRTSLRVTSQNSGAGNALARERERLVRAYEIMNNEIQTYENNLGFLSTNSKTGSTLAQEVTKKIDKLKEELSLLGQKIKAINEQLRKEASEQKEKEQ